MNIKTDIEKVLGKLEMQFINDRRKTELVTTWLIVAAIILLALLPTL